MDLCCLDDSSFATLMLAVVVMTWWFADCFVVLLVLVGRAYFQFGDVFNNGFDANGWFFSRICSHYVALMRFLQVSRVFAWYGRRLKILVMVRRFLTFWISF